MAIEPQEDAGTMIADHVRASDPDRFFISLLMPSAHRKTIWVLYAFYAELTRAMRITSQPVAALIRLQWWREVIEGTERAHPIALLVTEMIKQEYLKADDLEHLIAGHEHAIETSRWDQAAWRLYWQQTAGELVILTATILNDQQPLDETTITRLRDIGAAYGMASFLRCVQRSVGLEQALHGQIKLPHTEKEDLDGIVALAIDAQNLFATATRSTIPHRCFPAALVGVFACRDLKRLFQNHINRKPPPDAQGQNAKGIMPQRGIMDKLAVLMAWAIRRI